MSSVRRPVLARQRRPRTFARGRVAGVLLALLASAGCVNEAQEIQIGTRVANQVNAQVPLVRDAPLNLYVNTLGLMIARNSGRPNLDYRFYIVDTPQINAFALPGGYVYINRGLIERTRDVSELSAVLAHEIGHVAARHGARNLQRQMRTGSVVALLYQMILGREPALLEQDALNLGGALWAARNSRADEAEADKLAVDYLVRTGVDPRGMVELLTRLLAEERAQPRDAQRIQWFATHPATSARIGTTRRAIHARLPIRNRSLARNNASYPGFLQRLDALPPSPFPVALPLPMQ